MELILKQISEAMANGDTGQTQCLTKRALAMGIQPSLIIKQILEPTMQEIGVKFRREEVFIPDVLMSARAMHASLYLLKPLIVGTVGTKSSARGKVVLGTVAGDLHDIGKNIVGMMLEGRGYDIVDIGIDVPVSEFIHAVKKNNPDILGLSALLTTTMGKCLEVINALKESNLRHKPMVIVGGAPITKEFARKIGADGYAVDGPGTVTIVDDLLKNKYLTKKQTQRR